MKVAPSTMGSRKLRVVAVTGACLALGASSALAASLPKIPIRAGQLGLGQFQVKPASIVYKRDGSRFFDGHREPYHRAARLKWTSWTSTGGRGSGANWINNCTPNCAHGKYHVYPVRLHVWLPKHVGRRLLFTRITMRYTRKRPSGASRIEVFKLRHKHGNFFWTIRAGG
jgi:hypothetical protein